jgi:hypothetical protein
MHAPTSRLGIAMPAPDQPHEDPEPVVGEHLSSSDVARLNEALRALPAEIAASLRAKPLRVKEVRSRWLKWLALVGVVVAIGSGIFTLVSALTTPSIVHQVAPISRTAERLDRGLSGLDAAITRARARYRAVRERVAPQTAGGQAGGSARREFSIGGGAFRVTLDRDPNAPADGPLRGWRARIAPAR